MPVVNKEVIISAPLEKIFSFVNKPSNLPQIWPSLTKITDEKLLSNGGYTFRWTYKMGGMLLKGTGELTGIVLNQWFTVRTEGALDSTIKWIFRAKGIQTGVTLTVDYLVPSKILSWLSHITVVKMNDKEAELILYNLRTRFETMSEES